MSSQRRVILIWMFMLLLLANCMVRKENNKGDVVLHSTASVSPVVITTGTSASIQPSPTSTILPAVPSLSEDEAFALLYKMLHVGRICELPCWLNITPGQSSYSNANFEWGSFLQLAGTTKVLPRDFLYYFDYTTNKNDIFINTRTYLSPDSELIESIRIDTQVLRYVEIGKPDRAPVYDSKDYNDLLHAYLLPDILSTYGPPAHVILSMEIITAEPTSPDFFRIWLLYPANGAIMEYTGLAQTDGNVINVCPSDVFVSLWLVSPSDLDLYQKTLEDATGVDWSGLATESPFYKSTSDAIGMTSNEFYETFKASTSHCVKSPLSIWPHH